MGKQADAESILRLQAAKKAALKRNQQDIHELIREKNRPCPSCQKPLGTNARLYFGEKFCPDCCEAFRAEFRRNLEEERKLRG